MVERTTQAKGRSTRGGAAGPVVSEKTFELLASKLDAPRTRSKSISRASLVERLREADGPPIVTVVAPAGYGKTTLLAEWAQGDPESFAWLSVDERDNDPKVFLTYVAASLDRVEPVDPGVFDALASPGSSIVGMVAPRIGRAFASMSRPVVLVLDDVHLLQNRECQAAVAMLAEHVPAGSRVALASRHEPHLRMARLRAEGRILEFGPEDLSLDREEATSLLRDAGVELSDSDIIALHEKTEGWPAGLYLAALAIRAGGSVSSAVAAFGGDDLFVSDYLHLEVLSGFSDDEVRFLRRSAVLHTMSGPLCDAVLQQTDSAEVLARMHRSNELVVPLDRRGEWYRYHHLFREMLLTELERSEPKLVRALLRRAAAWCERNAEPEEAVEYSISADDERTVGRLIGMLALPMYRAGRLPTILRWCGYLRDRGQIERYPLVAVQASWLFALTGHFAEAEMWADAIDLEELASDASDEAAMARSLGILLQAALCRHGIETMRADSEEAIRTLGSSFGTPHLLYGIALLLGGDLEGADRAFEDAVEVSAALDNTVDQVLALSERALLAIERGDWGAAGSHASEARSIVGRAHLEDYSTSALVYAASARVEVHGADASAAHRYLLHAQRIRSQLTYALPHFAVQTRLELARAHVGLGEIAAARTLLREISDVLRHRPDLGTLGAQADQLRSQLAMYSSEQSGFQTLTAAELRLLPLLMTHFSFREIGEVLYISTSTVKTEAISIYRKLGASSRSEAVLQAQKIGLLEG